MKNQIISALLFIFSFPLWAQDNLVTINRNQTIKVVAPEGTTENILGMGFDSRFYELNFQAVKGKKVTTPEARYMCDYQQIDNLAELDANAKVFSLLKGSFSKTSNKRYAILNIYCINKTVTLEPQGVPAGNADYYVSKVHYGWALNYIICGEASEFTTDVSTNLQKWIGVGGDIKTYTYALKLQQELKLIGLTGKEDGVTIAKTPEETINKFIKTKTPVPILIEYKAIKDMNTQGIDWSSPMVTDGDYQLVKIDYKVSERKSDGKKWDIGLDESTTKPDIFMRAYLDGKEIYAGKGALNSYDGSIDISKIVNLHSNSVIKFSFWDKDMSTDDFIGDAEIRFLDLSKHKLNEDVLLNTTGQVKMCKLKIARYGT